jgi:hypothetical protein
MDQETCGLVPNCTPKELSLPSRDLPIHEIGHTAMSTGVRSAKTLNKNTYRVFLHHGSQMRRKRWMGVLDWCPGSDHQCLSKRFQLSRSCHTNQPFNSDAQDASRAWSHTRKSPQIARFVGLLTMYPKEVVITTLESPLKSRDHI